PPSHKPPERDLLPRLYPRRRDRELRIQYEARHLRCQERLGLLLRRLTRCLSRGHHRYRHEYVEDLQDYLYWLYSRYRYRYPEPPECDLLPGRQGRRGK